FGRSILTRSSVKQESACSVFWRLHPSANRFINSRKSDSLIPSRPIRLSHPPDVITKTSIARTKALPALSQDRVSNVSRMKRLGRTSGKVIIAGRHSMAFVFGVSLAELSQLGKNSYLILARIFSISFRRNARMV